MKTLHDKLGKRQGDSRYCWSRRCWMGSTQSANSASYWLSICRATPMKYMKALWCSCYISSYKNLSEQRSKRTRVCPGQGEHITKVNGHHTVKTKATFFVTHTPKISLARPMKAYWNSNSPGSRRSQIRKNLLDVIRRMHPIYKE